MSQGHPWPLALYRLATGLAEPIVPSLLKRRVTRGKEDPARLAERLGQASQSRPSGALAWLHGASVGEALSLLPLVQALGEARPELGLLVTAGTRTAAELLARRLPPGVIHQYAPIDAPKAARRFIDHWRPDLGVFVESELWPNLLLAARSNGTRLALLSAKLSLASFRGWSRAPRSAQTLLGAFDLILAQDATSAERLARLGGRVAGLADLKFGAEPLPADAAVLADLKDRLGERPLILAASTHPGEDGLVLEAFAAQTAAPQAEAALLVIVPRHPERGAAIAALAAQRGLSAGLRSGGATLGADRVHVADTLGELGLWFRLARLAVMGGGLVPDIGGHNPLEPTRLGCPFVSGPLVANWTSTYEALWRLTGGEPVSDTAGVARAMAAALEAPEAFTRALAPAQAYVAARDLEARSVTAQVLELLP